MIGSIPEDGSEQLFTSYSKNLLKNKQLQFSIGINYSTNEVLRSFRKNRERNIELPLGISYGVTDNLELSATLPFQYQSYEIVSPIDVDKTSQSNIGDISVGLSYKIKDEAANTPNISTSLNLTMPTGKQKLDESSISINSGYWSTSGNLQLSKSIDPVIVFANIGYQHVSADKEKSGTFGGMIKDEQSEDLPKNVFILEESTDCTDANDEGRALAQIIHDVAPDAQIFFQSGSNGLAKTANAILDLAFKKHVNIIVDDAQFLIANFYQPDAISQAIQRVTDAGITYITAAGNNGRNAYESTYNEYSNEGFKLNAHNFESKEKVSLYQKLEVPEGVAFTLTLQWEEPAYSISGGQGTQSDLDIFLFDKQHSQILAASTFNNIGRDPVENLDFFNPRGSGETHFDLMITKSAGASPKSFKYIIVNSIPDIIKTYQTNSGGLFGHANTEAALTIGASNYKETPAYGFAPPLVQYFSSAGGQSIHFDYQGKRIAPITPRKPDVVAPDNVNTTFFGKNDTDNDGFPNIEGTSAAAPHAAGVVALLLEANPKLQPKDIKNILQRTAIDIEQSNNKNKSFVGNGYDLDSGYGLIQAEAALTLAKNYDLSNDNKVIDDTPIKVNEISQGGTGSIDIFQLIFLIFTVLGLSFKFRQKTSV